MCNIKLQMPLMIELGYCAANIYN